VKNSKTERGGVWVDCFRRKGREEKREFSVGIEKKVGKTGIRSLSWGGEDGRGESMRIELK